MVQGLLPQNYLLKPPPRSTVKVTVRGKKSGELDTDVVLINPPDFFNWLPMGPDSMKLEVSTQFEGNPSSSFTFIAMSQYKKYVEITLAIGTELTFLGIGWRIDGINVTEVPYKQDLPGLIRVDVSLAGRQANYIEKPVPYRESLDTSKPCDEELKVKDKAKTMTVQQLAGRAGTTFSGPGSWKFSIPKDATKTESTTVSEQVNRLVRVRGCFLFYSDAEGLRAKQLNAVKTWTIDDSLIIGDTVSTSITGYQPNFVGKLKPLKVIAPNLRKGGTFPTITVDIGPKTITTEDPPILANWYWPPRKVEGAFVEDEKFLEEKKDSDRIKRKLPLNYYTLVDGDENPQRAIGEQVGDVRMNFDQSGGKKVETVTTYAEGVELTRKETTWGHAFSGQGLAQWDSGNERWNTVRNGGNWTKIREIKTKREFDRSGLFIGSTGRGWELIRFRQESDSVPETAIHASLGNRELTSNNISPLLKDVSADEALELSTNELSSSLVRIAGLYQFRRNTLYERTFIGLASMKGLYPSEDINESEEKVCLPNGEDLEIDDSDPQYIAYEKKESSSYASIPNPEYMLQNAINNTLDLTIEEKQDRAVPWYLETGSNTISIRKVTPIPSFYANGTDFWREYNSEFNASNPSFTKKLQQATVKEHLGRVSEHSERLPELFDQEEEDDSSNREVEEGPDWEYSLFTPVTNPSGQSNLIAGSLSFDAAKTFNEAVTAAKTDLIVSNFSAIGNKTIKVKLNKDTIKIQEGDKIELTLNGHRGTYRVTAKKFELVFQGKLADKHLVTSPGVDLTLCPEPVVTVVTRKTKIKKPIKNVLRYASKSLNRKQRPFTVSINQDSAFVSRFNPSQR